MNRGEVLSGLEKRRGELMGITLGSGIYYKYAEVNGLDLAFLISAGKFRQMGLSSLAGSMPYLNANKAAWDVAVHEVLPQNPKIPIVLGVCATDPTIDLPRYICKIKEYGLSGICNMPTVILVDGHLGAAMEKAGFSFRKEAEVIRLAHEADLFTTAMVSGKEQAKEMLDAGCDALCVHFGAASGGMLGARREVNIQTAIGMAQEILGGLHERWFIEAKPEEIAGHLKEAVESAGRQGLILGPGCVAKLNTPEINYYAARVAVENL